LHLKTRGRHYHDRARELEALDARHPDVGAGCAALALHALAEAMERARIGRLTRYQHILLRLGEWIAFAECAGSLARRAALLAEGRLSEKANQRFDAPALAAISRIFARDAALRVAQEGLRWIVGAMPAGITGDGEVAAFEAALNLSAIRRAQVGLIPDMDFVADVLYGRATRAARVA
jgi:alkylation response protein AidB-like acyl-CoA dehydrogenase